MNEPPKILTFKREELVDQKPASVAIHVSASSSGQLDTLPGCSGSIAKVDSLNYSQNSMRNNSTEIDIPVKSEPVDSVSNNAGINAEFLMDTQSGSITVNQQVEGLDRHEQTHTGERPFRCSFCEKSFTTKIKHNLDRHERTHTGVKSFQCSFCEKSFTTKQGLDGHERTHTGERPFQCSLCEKSFARSSALNQHDRTHTGERPFHCSFCEKSFRTKQGLDGHERTHTGERPFHCSFCEKSFTTKQGLDGHERTHTGERPFQCSFCERSYVRSSALNQHERTHTGKRSHAAKNVQRDWLDLDVPVWDTGIVYSDDGQRIVTCTAHHQLRLYDTRAQRRPVNDVEWEQHPFTALSLTHREHCVVAGTSRGRLAMFDLRKTGQAAVIHAFRGIAGSVTDIQASRTAPFIVSSNLDRFFRVHQADSKELQRKLYMKSRLSCVLLNSSARLLKTCDADVKEENEVSDDGSSVVGLSADEAEDEDLWNSMKQVNSRKRKEESEAVPNRKKRKAKLGVKRVKEEASSDVEVVEEMPVATKKRKVKSGKHKQEEVKTEEDAEIKEEIGEEPTKRRKREKKNPIRKRKQSVEGAVGVFE